VTAGTNPMASKHSIDKAVEAVFGEHAEQWRGARRCAGGVFQAGDRWDDCLGKGFHGQTDSVSEKWFFASTNRNMQEDPLGSTTYSVQKSISDTLRNWCSRKVRDIKSTSPVWPQSSANLI
jgi:hypothetical protein